MSLLQNLRKNSQEQNTKLSLAPLTQTRAELKQTATIIFRTAAGQSNPIAAQFAAVAGNKIAELSDEELTDLRANLRKLSAAIDSVLAGNENT